MVDEWLGDLRSLRDLRRSTIRSYSEAVRAVLPLRHRPALRVDGDLRGAVRHPPGPGGARVEHRGARPGQRGGPEEARVHQGRAARLLRRTATTRSPASGPSAARAGCPPSATRRCSRPPTPTGCGATRRGCSTPPTSAATRTAREFGEYGRCQVRFGKAKKGSPPKRRSVLTVWTGRRTSWTSGSPRSARCSAPTTTRRLWPSERGLRIGCQRLELPFHRLPQGPGPGRRARLPLAAKVLRHPPDRGRLGPALRPGAGRPRARQHHLDLHLRVLGLPHPHPAAAPGRHHRRGPADPDREAEHETQGRLHRGGCAR